METSSEPLFEHPPGDDRRMPATAQRWQRDWYNLVLAGFSLLLLLAIPLLAVRLAEPPSRPRHPLPPPLRPPTVSPAAPARAVTRLVSTLLPPPNHPD